MKYESEHTALDEYLMKANRNHGLDTLRSAAIILVFIFHYSGFSETPMFGALGRSGWAGVELFFVLSGYLIGNQIFSIFSNQGVFSLKTFYFRRLLRTMPNYFFVLGLYLMIPIFREQPLTTPTWKFFTFFQNFGLTSSAFSHAWSLCLEEQFYFILPLIGLLIANKSNVRTGWLLIGFILLGGIILRTSLWLSYFQSAEETKFSGYMTTIYYFPFCRLDGLMLGVSIAMLKNFHKNLWIRFAKHGTWFMVLGLLGCYFTLSPLENIIGFTPTVFGYLLRSASFAALTLSALSTNSILYKIKIPGTMNLATWSYAIYLTHKSLIHITHSLLSYWAISEVNIALIAIDIFICLSGGWLLYQFIESPFLKLRDKFGKTNSFDGNKGTIASRRI